MPEIFNCATLMPPEAGRCQTLRAEAPSIFSAWRSLCMLFTASSCSSASRLRSSWWSGRHPHLLALLER